MAKFKTQEQFIEAVCDYKKGWTNLKNASTAISQISGLSPEIAETFLKYMKRDNVTQIRGYSKEPERLLKGKRGKFNELKRK
tara:strand:+ start:1329 stop:1574 length:246 start_codon:yes stop_codon:yes gene_type:complete